MTDKPKNKGSSDLRNGGDDDEAPSSVRTGPLIEFVPIGRDFEEFIEKDFRDCAELYRRLAQ